MKRAITTALAALTILGGVLGPAGDAHAIAAYLSYWNGSDIDSGYGVGAKHKIQIVPIVSGELRAGWLSFDKDSRNTNLIPLEAAARAKLAMMYAGAGVGYYVFTGDDPTPDDTFGGFLMGGYEFTLAGLGAFAELKYTWVEPDVASVKADAGGIGINVGVIFDWI